MTSIAITRCKSTGTHIQRNLYENKLDPVRNQIDIPVHRNSRCGGIFPRQFLSRDRPAITLVLPASYDASRRARTNTLMAVQVHGPLRRFPPVLANRGLILLSVLLLLMSS